MLPKIAEMGVKEQRTLSSIMNVVQDFFLPRNKEWTEWSMVAMFDSSGRGSPGASI